MILPSIGGIKASTPSTNQRLPLSSCQHQLKKPANGDCFRCLEAILVGERQTTWGDTSQRPRQSVPIHSLYRATGWSGLIRCGWQCGIPTIMLWLRRLTAYIKPKSSIKTGRGLFRGGYWRLIMMDTKALQNHLYEPLASLLGLSKPSRVSWLT